MTYLCVNLLCPVILILYLILDFGSSNLMNLSYIYFLLMPFTFYFLWTIWLLLQK